MEILMKSIQACFNTFLTLFLACQMALLPMTVGAAPLTPDGTTATTVTSAQNGVPVVNIAKPSASGLSHNTFTDYNVNANGLILNNTPNTIVQTQLGGFILGNQNLTNSATAILNEVTSTNRSALNGYTEVAGPRTDLIIANPNGITINGAGFINTGNLTLTTGNPNVVNGSLNSLNVNGGDITINGTGLNTQTQDSTSIYTQAVTLNAQLHAKNLDMKLGNNMVSYPTKTITASAPTTTPTGLLLDSSALGGMYADRITLVGTGAGLGVNLPPEVLASVGDINITNDGTIALQKTSAGGNVNVSSANGVSLAGNLYSGGSAAVAAGTNVTVNAGVVAGAKAGMNINANQLTNAGTLVAGLNADQTLNTTGSMNIAAQTVTNNGDIQSTGNLVASGATFTNNGMFNAGNDLTLKISDLTNNMTLFAGNNMNLYTTGVLSNTANSNIFALNNLTMAANAAGGKSTSIINDQADIQALNGNINMNALSFTNMTTAPVITTTTSGVPGGVQTTTDVLQTRFKEAQLLSGGNINLNADSILNRYSLISANGNINVTSNALVNEFINLNQQTITPTAQTYIFYTTCGFLGQGSCANVGTRIVNVVTNATVGTVSSTIQAAGNITGNVANLASTGINANQVVNTTPTPFQQTLAAGNSLPVQAPVGNNGIFVLSPNPQSQFLIETNPKFVSLGIFISSNYLLSKLNVPSALLTTKRLGDAFYENKLIRDSIFAQTGRRFLNSNLTSDNAQYQYLMDNALAAQQDLQLVPGISLTHAQIAMLKQDIVWLEEQTVAGQQVLVPVVYIANMDEFKLEGGKVIAGNDLELTVTQLENSGLLEAGKNLSVDASDKVNGEAREGALGYTIRNQNGSIRAGEDVNLMAQNNIENISANIKGKNITLVSADGNIINKRQTEDVTFTGENYWDSQTIAGLAGNIEADNNLSLKAGNGITIAGSKLKGKDVSLDAKQVEITTTVQNAESFGGQSGSYSRQESTTHLGSDIEGENVAINSSGKTTVRGSNIHADKKLTVSARELEIAAVNNSDYRETKVVKKGLFSKSASTNKKARSTNIASNLSGENVSLTTVNDLESTAAGGDINIVGSNVTAKEQLALESAGNIIVQAGFDGTLDESQTQKSGWFSGGKLFSKSDDLEGKLTKTAAKATLSGTNVALNAEKDIALAGVDATVDETLSATAQNISIANVDNEVKTYSKHEKLDVSLGDAAKMLTRPDKMIQKKDGKVSVTLAKAEYDKAETVTTKTEVVSSDIQAGNIDLTASSASGEPEGGALEGESVEENNIDGNITIKGSNLAAVEAINLTADSDVTVQEAKNTESTTSKEQKGKAELSFTVKNEYVQIAYAIKAAKESKDNLQNAKSSYDQYKQDLGKQRGNLLKLKADLANGRLGIEQADVDEMQGLIDDLASDDAFYKANIALAAADLAAKTVAVVKQMATASSAIFYGFNASLDLDIDMLEKQFSAYQEQSVASNLNADKINISAGEAATIRGSNANAREINIDGENVRLLASNDINTSNSSSDHKNVNISIGLFGGASSASASMDRSKSDNSGITNSNSQLVADNITINTDEKTTVAGANVYASDTLDIQTGSLEVASVQDSQKSNSKSLGFSISGGESGITGGGVNAGNSRSNQKSTVLTTLSGNSVNIDVKEDTTLRGAMIAAVDAEGNDNGNLKLKTGTLEVGSMNNTRDSKSMSMGVNVSISNTAVNGEEGSKKVEGEGVVSQKTDHSISSVGIDFANDNSHSKTKTLGTIGNGSIEVANADASNTTLLNRDINDKEIDIYNIESHKGLKGTVDTRMLTEDGRAEIKKEFNEFGKNMQIVAKGLPEANNGNAIIALIGKGLDKLSEYTGGILPSNGSNGGLLGNIPVMMGDSDINHKIIQVASSDSNYVKTNPELFVPLEESDYFKSASPANQDALRGQSLFVSKEPIGVDDANKYYQDFITEDNATYQNFTNGMLNTEGDAIKNGMDQTGSRVFTVNYNPTHGFVGDGLESAVDKAGGTTGIAKQTGEFYKDVTTARGELGSNNANHSQGNLLAQQGIKYQQEHNGFQDQKGIHTVSSFGSPVNTKDMKKTVESSGFAYTGASTKPGDFVGEGLGGNKGNNEQMGTSERLKSVTNIPKLFTADSPHSTYKCGGINSKDKCGENP